MARFGMIAITFHFTNSLPVSTSKTKRTSQIEVSKQVLSHPSFRDDILELAQFIAALTKFAVSVSCSSLDMKHYVVKSETSGLRIDSGHYVSRFAYKNYSQYNQRVTGLTIPGPELPKTPQLQNYINARLVSFDKDRADDIMQAYLMRVDRLNNILLKLLNCLPHNKYVLTGFEIQKYDSAAVKRELQHKRKLRKEKEKIERRLAKQKETLTLNPNAVPPIEPKTGAGRTVGARPGIFDGVQMRSQLEIRVAAELKERGIRWIYEPEAVGPAGYLVDFYLPDLGKWIEVKGRFDARDRLLLPEVAKTLKDRGQKLFVYTSSGPCLAVSPTGQREVERAKFWIELLR